MKQQAAEFAEPFRSAIMAVPEGTEVIDVRLADWPCLEWDNRRGRATLVGDAAHAMTMCKWSPSAPLTGAHSTDSGTRSWGGCESWNYGRGEFGG